MKNKLTALLLAVVVSIGIFPCTGLAAKASVNDAIGLMNAVGVIAEGKIIDDTLDEPISRMTFALYMAKLLGIDEEAGSEMNYFYDVPEDHWGKYSLNGLVEMKIISAADHFFRPDDIITKREAATMAVAAIGRKNEADLKGGYPGGYLAVASERKLLSGIESADEMTNRDAAILLYNTAIEDAVQLGFADNRPVYAPDDETVLSMYHDIYYGEGLVSAIDGVSIDYHQITGENEIIIGEEILSTDEWHYDKLGYDVKYFYKDNDGDKELVYIFEELDDDADVIELTSDLYDGYDGSSITYYESEDATRTKKKDIYPGAIVIRNGEKVSNDIASALDKATIYGELKFINTGRYDGIDIVIINDYENIIVSHVNTVSKVVYDKNAPNNPLDLNEENHVFVKYFNQDRTSATFDNISEGKVLSVVASSDRKFVIVYIVDKGVKGTITAKGYDEYNKPYLTIDEDSYEVDQAFYAQNVDSFAIGATGAFSFDLFNMIVAVDMDKSGDMQYAYLINAYIVNDVDMVVLDTERVLFRMFTANGELISKTCAEKVRIDNAIFKDCQTILDYFSSGGVVKAQPIRFKYDSDGNIKVVDTLTRGVGESEISLRKINKDPESYYHWSGIWSNTAFVSNNTPIMIVPNPGTEKNADASKFAIQNQTSLRVSTSHKIDFLTTDPEAFSPEVAVCYSEPATTIATSDPIYVVEKVTSALNDEDEECLVITLDDNGDSDFVVAPDYNDYVLQGNDINGWDHVDPSTLTPGDVVRIGKNSNDEVNNIKLMFNYGTAKSNSSETFFNNAIHPSYRLSKNEMSGGQTETKFGYGYVSKKWENVYGWGFDSPTEINQLYASNIETNKIKVMEFDAAKKNDKCTSSKTDALVSYEETRTDFSKIIVLQTDKILSKLIIYK